ncbi:MAG: DUF4870 domain-containing protein [Candidatus Beckwithbacteria bacterium]|nr:DUF4870 domain-containing protein [Candidatus Beckwithbacteria bacterium]
MATTKKIAFGLEEKTAGALAYVLGWVSGLVFLLAEKDNKFVRFHAMQALMFFAAMTVLSFVPVIGWLLSPFVLIVSFVVWLLAIYKAYNGQEFELPVVGKLARKQLAKMK